MRSNECVTMLLLSTFLLIGHLDALPSKSAEKWISSSQEMKDEGNKPKCTVTESCADCSCLNLQTVPKRLPENITCLNLRGNNITSIDGKVFRRYRNLTRLSLSNNSIQMIGEEDFKYLAHLEMLDLSLNQIRYDNIDVRTFKDLPSLYYLDLKQTIFQGPNSSYPQSLSDLKEIEFLMIDGIDSPIPYLPNLEELYLSGQYGSCVMPSLTADLFQNIPNIRKLYLSNCSIIGVEKGTFQKLSSLESLDVSWNMNLSFQPMNNITFGLHRTKITRLNFNNVYEYYKNDVCTTLYAENIEHLNKTSIELLTLEGNNIVRTDASAVPFIPRSLKYLSMRDNSQMFGYSTELMIKLHLLKQIVYFDDSRMFSSHMPPDISPDIVSDIPPTKETCIPCGTLFTRDHIKTYFEIIDDRLMKFNITPVGGSKHPKNTEQKAIEYLDLSESLSDSYKLMFELFDSPGTLRYLNMSGMYLGYALLDSSTFFDKFVNLTTLDIGTNGIIGLKVNIFDNLRNLKRLYLGNNKIANITFNIHLLSKISYLDLHSNHLEFLDKKAMDALDKLQNITVNMVDNSLVCSCDQQNLDFLRWMLVTRTNFENINQMHCVFKKNETRIAIPDLNFEQFKYECQPPTFQTLTLITSLCILTFLLIVFGGLLYRYRWNLRYLYYMTKFKLTDGYQLLDDGDYEKDIFVSYAEEDGMFVREYVLPQLEDTGYFSLLVHGRDFQAGEYVADNIVRAVTSTRRTLVILTKAYIQSKWCMYEMNIARLEGISTNRNCLCVVMKENIPVKHLPIEIIDIIRSRTYIDYPDNAVDQRDFWERLKITLR